MEALNNITKVADSYLSVLHTNPYVSGTLSVFLILYASLAAPTLPPFIASLFENSIFKVLIFFLILAVRSYNPTVALLVAIGFLISMQTLSNHRVFSMAGDFNLMGALKSGINSVSDTLSNLSSEKYSGAGPELVKDKLPFISPAGHEQLLQGSAADEDRLPNNVDRVFPPKQDSYIQTSDPMGYPGRDLASYGQADSEL